ncbi:YjbQ family protein, partial [Candidatus Woesearchaeota archaeon]|nr:YjbQ family protein [Candidatus Woesearchaeota archaeon]
MMEQLGFKTEKKEQMIDLTDRIQETVARMGIREGLCLVYCPHTTAAVTINENADPDVKHDILMKLHQLADDKGYEHSEGNSDAHVVSSLIGCSEVLPVSESKLCLGTWQGIMFLEFDGPRDRKIL